jgi:small neutral amino acid transporter SnatA (MarC family)
MSPLLIKISKDFATLWTTIDPIGNVALFAGLTAALSRPERHLTALRAVIYATLILVAAGTIGQVILDAIGIHMHSLKVAGGVIETHSLPTLTRSYPRRFTFYVAEPISSVLFLFGVQMLFGKWMRKGDDSKSDKCRVIRLR